MKIEFHPFRKGITRDPRIWLRYAMWWVDRYAWKWTLKTMPSLQVIKDKRFPKSVRLKVAVLAVVKYPINRAAYKLSRTASRLCGIGHRCDFTDRENGLLWGYKGKPVMDTMFNDWADSL